MADDLNKNITITVSAETDKLEQSITNLNKLINNLLTQQKQLVDSGSAASAAFQNNADKLDIYQKSLQSATAQLNSYLAAINTSISTAQKDQSLITALTATRDKYAKTLGDNSKKVTDLNNALKILTTATQQQHAQSAKSQASLDAHGKSIKANAKQVAGLKNNLSKVSGALKQQKQDVDDNKKSFDLHGKVMDHLKTSFDEIKNVSGEFGPSLQDVAQGFNVMKSGLSIVQGGLKGVGEAIEADGFGLLLQILQQLFNAFVNSSKGSKILQGVISAIGAVVNKVQTFFNNFKNGIIDAVTHPIDSLKALGRMIEQNIINRFKAFSVILDGIIHLDFKKVADGAIQAVSGVTDATDKIVSFVKTATDEIVQTGTEIGEAYTKGYAQAAKAQEEFHEKSKRYSSSSTANSTSSHRDTTILGGASSAGLSQTDNQLKGTLGAYNIAATQSDAKKVVDIHKTTFQQIEDYAKQNEQKIATDALNTLSNSIKQQAAAKVAALESKKNAELRNTSLTSGQKLAIQAKFKKQEDKIKAKAFKEEQELNIAKTLMNAAQAAIKLWADPGFPGAIAQTVVLGAETAAQIAQIAAQKPPAYATGGLHYTSDGKGGMLPGYSRTDNTNAYLRSGEGVVVSEAMRDPWARNLVSAINVGFGGRDFSTTATGRGFAVGGIFTDGGDANRYYNAPVNDQKNLANTIAYQMINNFPPVYVDVKDINNQQNILAQTINRVNL